MLPGERRTLAPRQLNQGNTNPKMMKADLSEGERTLTYTQLQWDSTSIVMNATDAYGVWGQ